jgi:heme/copper-type cytochrome/quinol oxidase subunit 2
MVLMFNPAAQALANPVQVALKTSPLMVIVFLLVAVLGVIAQVRANRNYTIEAYNRWETAP